MTLAGQQILGLSLLQPWASFMALGEKKIETRSWGKKYRGLIAIASSKRWAEGTWSWAERDPACQSVWRKHGIGDLHELPLGVIVAVGRLTACVRTEELLAIAAGVPGLLPHELEFGDYSHGRFAWMFDEVRPLATPIRVRGSLGLYALEQGVREQLDVAEFAVAA